MYVLKLVCCVLCGMIIHNTLLTAQENDNYIQSKSQLLKSEAYYLNEKEVISSQEKNFNAEYLKSAIKGIKYAIIELSALEQEKADRQDNKLVDRLSQYLYRLGFTQVAYKTKEKNKLILSVPSYCDLVRVRFQMIPNSDYFENLQMSFQACKNKPIHISYSEKLQRNPYILDSLESLWRNYFDEYIDYDIQKRWQLSSYPIIATKRQIYEHQKNKKALLDDIEGIFEKVPEYNYSEKKHTIAILKNETGNYDIIYLDGASNYLDWKEGEWMGKINAEAENGIYKEVKWLIPNKSLQGDAAIQMKEDKLILKFNNHGEYIYKKLNSTQTLTNTVGLDGKGSAGSGVLIDKRGFILTSYNVVGNGNGRDIIVVLPKIDNEQQVNTEDKWAAKVVMTDVELDLALLKVQDDEASFRVCDGIPYQFKNQEANVGEKVFTLGYPLVASMGMHPKLAVGEISSVKGYKNEELSYQTSVEVYAGNSGSPLFDYEGRFLGLLKNKHSEASRVSYALKSNSILQFLEQSGLFNSQELMNVPNTLEGLPLTEQIKQLKPFVFYIYSE